MFERHRNEVQSCTRRNKTSRQPTIYKHKPPTHKLTAKGAPPSSGSLLKSMMIKLRGYLMKLCPNPSIYLRQQRC
jgi:hypothetical protein